jgi:hypothetical protein
MVWLLDTNILSELRRSKPHRRVVEFVGNCPIQKLYVSAVTLAEIRFGRAFDYAAYGCLSADRRFRPIPGCQASSQIHIAPLFTSVCNWSAASSPN